MRIKIMELGWAVLGAIALAVLVGMGLLVLALLPGSFTSTDRDGPVVRPGSNRIQPSSPATAEFPHLQDQPAYRECPVSPGRDPVIIPADGYCLTVYQDR